MGKLICRRTSSQHDLISGAGDLIGNNEDLLRNILIHVPHKSLTGFKAVSKLWLFVITDPHFSLQWRKKHAGSISALFIHRYFNYEFVSLDGQTNNPFVPNFGFDSIPLFDHCRHRIEVLQCCNSLLLINLEVKLNNLRLYEDRIGVYDTINNHSKLIPKFPQKYSQHTNYTRLAFDPLKSPHYKLISILLSPRTRIRNEILIYSSETDSWRTLSQNGHSSLHIINKYYGCIFEAGVYLNGMIHWPCNGESFSFYFDVDKECLAWMPMPPIQGAQEKRTIRYFAESGGHLHLIDYMDDFAMQFDVLEMERDYSKWFVKYSVDLFALGHGRIKRYRIVSLIVKNGNKVEAGEESPILVIYVPVDKMIISYNLQNGESKKLCSLSLNSWEIDNLKIKNWLIVRQITY